MLLRTANLIWRRGTSGLLRRNIGRDGRGQTSVSINRSRRIFCRRAARVADFSGANNHAVTPRYQEDLLRVFPKLSSLPVSSVSSVLLPLRSVTRFSLRCCSAWVYCTEITSGRRPHRTLIEGLAMRYPPAQLTSWRSRSRCLVRRASTDRLERRILLPRPDNPFEPSLNPRHNSFAAFI